jgi:hypothetical protein
VAQLQFLGDSLVTAQIGLLQVFEQTAALADHHEQPAARAVVLLVALQMFGEMVDALGQQRNLNIGRTRVLAVDLKLVNRLRLRFHILFRTRDGSYAPPPCKALSPMFSACKKPRIAPKAFGAARLYAVQPEPVCRKARKERRDFHPQLAPMERADRPAELRVDG